MKKALSSGICILVLALAASVGFAQTDGQTDQMMQHKGMTGCQMMICDQMHQMSQIMGQMSDKMKNMTPEHMKEMSAIMKNMSKQMMDMSKMMDKGTASEKAMKKSQDKMTQIQDQWQSTERRLGIE